MPLSKLSTTINAPVERCFLLSLNVDLHQLSTGRTNEKAIAGVMSGVMKLNDTVTWRAKHFGIYQTLTSKITEYKYPEYFVDEMTEGVFKKLHHRHTFESDENGTIMTDEFDFEAPFGMLGKLFSKLVLTNYLKKFLIERNLMIKGFAEGDGWRKLLS